MTAASNASETPNGLRYASSPTTPSTEVEPEQQTDHDRRRHQRPQLGLVVVMIIVAVMVVGVPRPHQRRLEFTVHVWTSPDLS